MQVDLKQALYDMFYASVFNARVDARACAARPQPLRAGMSAVVTIKVN